MKINVKVTNNNWDFEEREIILWIEWNISVLEKQADKLERFIGSELFFY